MNREALSRIEIAQGDITRLTVDVIVNAANEQLAGGGGVDGAIHRAAGQAELQAACRAIGGCRTGKAVITPGFALTARHIIHTVGPVWRGGERGEPELLASAYRCSLELAAAHGLRSLAFPAISTGVYGYPFEPATRTALETTAAFLAGSAHPERVVLIFFSEADARTARDLYARAGAGAPESS